MGKKRVVDKTKRFTKTDQKAAGLAAKKIKGKTITRGRAYIHSTYNNTIITLTDEDNNVITSISAGMLGFRGPKRATPYAASEVARTLLARADQTGLKELEVYVRGIGAGRGAAIRSLASHGVDMVFIKDITPIPHGGVRPPKPRRV
jgi:small subunit ribosomal protein S11